MLPYTTTALVGEVRIELTGVPKDHAFTARADSIVLFPALKDGRYGPCFMNDLQT